MGEVREGNFGASKPKSSAENKNAENRSFENKPAATVVDMGAFKTRKHLSADRKTSVSEAFSGMTSRTQSPADRSSEMELAERIERIKGSIQRINQLMAELKGVSSDGSKPAK
jgi:hypothetical protein